jgi:hypothetical protein
MVILAGYIVEIGYTRNGLSFVGKPHEKLAFQSLRWRYYGNHYRELVELVQDYVQ